jgi:hypothetical protein
VTTTFTLSIPHEKAFPPGHIRLKWADISCYSRQKIHGGKQRILAHGDKESSFWIDGRRQCYFYLTKGNGKNLDSLSVIQLTPPTPK